MDFSAERGSPIYATGDGKISRADNRAAGFGNHIRIDHGFGYVSIYAHLDIRRRKTKGAGDKKKGSGKDAKTAARKNTKRD